MAILWQTHLQQFGPLLFILAIYLGGLQNGLCYLPHLTFSCLLLLPLALKCCASSQWPCATGSPYLISSSMSWWTFGGGGEGGGVEHCTSPVPASL